MRSRQFQERLDEAVAEGWEIERETPDRAVLVRRNYGSLGVHFFVALFTFWWAFGLFNLLYGAYKYLNDSERKVLREPLVETCPECGESNPAGAEYCRQCGADVGSGSSARADEATICPGCEAAVAEGSRFCSYCGTQLAEAAER